MRFAIEKSDKKLRYENKYIFNNVALCLKHLLNTIVELVDTSLI